MQTYIRDVKKIESELKKRKSHKLLNLKTPSYNVVHNSEVVPKYTELAPKSISGDKKLKRFFVKDFTEEFSLVGEIEYSGDDWPVMLLESGHFKLAYELNIFVTDPYILLMPDGGNNKVMEQERDFVELSSPFCGREVHIRMGPMGRKRLGLKSIGEGILEIKSASQWVSITSLLVKRRINRSLSRHLGAYSDWIEDLDKVISAPQTSNLFFFSNYSNPKKQCQMIHLENIFDTISLTVALVLDYNTEELKGLTLCRKNDSCFELHSEYVDEDLIFEISIVRNANMEEKLDCEIDESQILCKYKGSIIIIKLKNSEDYINFDEHSYFCYEKSQAKVMSISHNLKCFFTYTTPEVEYMSLV